MDHLLCRCAILEYVCTVWDPHTQENIHRLEMVQRRYARFVVGDYRRTSSVTEMLRCLQWPSLQERRAQFKVLVIYRIVNLHVQTDTLQHCLLPVSRSHRGHEQQFHVP